MGTRQEPWEKYPDVWRNKTAFFTYLRGHLRLLWSRYPAKLKWKTSKLKAPPKGYTGRAKKLGTCHYCGEDFAASHLEVDHVQQAGTCNSWETSSEFLYNLLDCNDNWVLACKPCHKIKSHQEKSGGTFAEARADKEIIRLLKVENKQEMLDMFTKHEYNITSLTNNTKRKKALSEILKGESIE